MSHVLPNHILITEAMLDSGQYEPNEIRRMLTSGDVVDLFILEESVIASERGILPLGNLNLAQVSDKLFNQYRNDPEECGNIFLEFGSALARLHRLAVGR
jgi:hypothetical protein